ncbi:MAG TPA: hypothetical protein VFR41_02165 [Acidimicrobiia bacterium]|nr:hypothetical protein [Acidimicrobiia bacterium]
MRRWFGRGACALGVAMALTPAMLAGPAGAASRPSSTQRPSVLSLSLQPDNASNLAVQLDAGATRQATLLVQNHSTTARLTVRLSATDAIGNPDAGPGGWLAFGDEVLQIEPGSSARVSLAVAVPHDTQPSTVLAHVVARVESAVNATSGAKTTVQAQATLPVEITVNGAPTAQLAIIDVHRIDQKSAHQLAVVVRNFGDQSAAVDATMKVITGRPQTLHFHAEVGARRDSTVLVPWDAAPTDVATEIEVDMRYAGGDIASWSSSIGTPPTTVAAPSTDVTTPVSTQSSDVPATIAGTSTSKPWYKGPLLVVFVVLLLVAAAVWFFFELRRSSRRRRDAPALPMGLPFVMAPGWNGGSDNASSELAKQLVALTEIIVKLTTHDEEIIDIATRHARARSPGARAPAWFARAGPPPTVEDAAAETVAPTSSHPIERDEPSRSASEPPSASARPEDAPVVDPRAEAIQRLMELDRERRQLRKWMDTTDSVTEPDSSNPAT